MNDTIENAPEIEPVLKRDNGRYNTAAIRRQALRVSAHTRQGKFTRVSTEFIDNLVAIIEAKQREFEREAPSPIFGQVPIPEDENFLTGDGKKRLIAAFNTWIAREIHREVNKVRVGKTL